MPVLSADETADQADGDAAGRRRQEAIVERLFGLLERQIRRIEDRMAAEDAGGAAVNCEVEARTLASLVRMVDRLAELKRVSETTLDRAGQEQDAERIRHEIAQRLERMCAEAEN